MDFISTPEVIEYLQIGDEGVTHNKLDDGSVEIIAATGDAIQNSGFNIDYTITCNGLHLTDEEMTASAPPSRFIFIPEVPSYRQR